MKLKFLGATGTVTGSKYLLSTSENTYLIDCGLFQGLKDLRLRNWQEPEFAPEKIKAIVLTHAHIDHSGYIPKLINLGFSGRIFCSHGTFELAKILLPDSGYLQEEEARFANAHGYSKHKPALPLYTRDDAERALELFHPIDFHVEEKIGNDCRISLSRAGHIVGASCVRVMAASRTIVFSGDVGRYHDLIMHAPEPLQDADYLVLESTYGDRDHETEDPFERLSQIINRVVAQKGVLIIPAFAVGRAQHILHIIQELRAKKKIPTIPTFLDSPMAIDATDLYCKFSKEHRLNDKACALMGQTAILTRAAEASRAIAKTKSPKIIISASGMASGGRVLHHLAEYVNDARNIIAFVGYQAAGTRGRALLDGASQIKMFGEHYPVHAQVEFISSLSAHADRKELLHWLKESGLKHPKVFITHGEPEASAALAKKLRKAFQWTVHVPSTGDEYTL